MLPVDKEIVPHPTLDQRLEDETFFDKMVNTYVDLCDFGMTEASLGLPKGSINQRIIDDKDFSLRFTQTLIQSCSNQTIFILPAALKAIRSSLVDLDDDPKTVLLAVAKLGELMNRLNPKQTPGDGKKEDDELTKLYKTFGAE